GIRDVVHLGDALSGPLEAAKAADLLLLLDPEGLHGVRGNHDRYLLEMPVDRLGPSDAHAQKELCPRHVAWLRKLPFDRVFRDEVYLCHATPRDDNPSCLEPVSADDHVTIRPQAEIEALEEVIEQPLILCGHSHIARMVQL